MTTPYYEYALCYTLGPGGKVEVATINSNERLTVRYTDPINEPLSPYVTALDQSSQQVVLMSI